MLTRKWGLSRASWLDRRDACWLGGILLLAAVLRGIRLGTYPFWHDEVQAMTDRHIALVDKALEEKQAEIMQV